MNLIALFSLDLWCRVKHRQFDPSRLYKALALADYSQTGSAFVVLINEHGYLWFVRQSRCIFKAGDVFSGKMDESKLPPWPPPPGDSSAPISDLEAGDL